MGPQPKVGHTSSGFRMSLKAVILILLTVAQYAPGRHQQRLKLLRDTVNYQNVQESYFRVNQKYKFKYDGQVNIGVPDHSTQYSSSRFKADVTLVKRSDDHFIVRLNNIRLGKQLAQLEDQDEMYSLEQFEPVELKQSDLKTLELPVEFTYAEGQVQDLVFQQDDEEWSENWKRGVINLFQIKLQPTDRTSMEEEQAALNRINTESETDVGTAYRTTEKTVEGECEASYTVSPLDDRREQEASRMLVTKAINLNNCRKRPEPWENFQFFSRCPRCAQLPRSAERTVDSSTTIRYQIRGKRDKFLIERAELCNDHVVAQQNADESTVVVKIRASLKLVSSEEWREDSSDMYNFPTTGQRVSDLIYSTRNDEHVDRFHSEGDQHYQQRYYSQRQHGQDKSAMLAELIMKMLRHMKDTADEKANRYFYKAVYLMRQMSESEIKSASENYFGRQQRGPMTPEEQERARNMMPNLLAQAGTLSSIRQLIEKISNREMSPIKAAVVITTMMHTPRVSKEMITEMMRFERSEIAQRNRHIRTAILLTTGSMMKTMCMPMRHGQQNTDDGRNYYNEEQACDSETKQYFVRTIADQMAKSNRWEDKVVLIRTLGNAGLDASISELESIIRNRDRRYSASLRLEAVLATRHLRQSLPQKTKNILLSAASNRMESSAVRMAAIQLLLQQYPDKMSIDQMGVLINHDPNRRVASFAYKLIRRLADSEQPCYEENKFKMQTVARSVRRRNLQLPYSDMIFESFYDREKKAGFDFFLMPMYEMDEMVPKFMRAGFNVVERGLRSRNLWAFDIGTSSMSNVLSDILEDMEPMTQQDQRSGNMEYKMNLRRMSEKMGQTGRYRNSDARQQQTKAWMSMKFRNQDIMLLTFDEHWLRRLMQGYRGKESLIWMAIGRMASIRQGMFNMDEATLLRETVIKMPTAIGSQLCIRRKSPAMFSAQGQTSMERGAPMRGNIKARISMTISMVTDVSSRTPMFINGIYLVKNIKATVPIDMTISIDHKQENEQLKIQMRNPGTSKDLLKLESRPVIYWRRSENPLADGEEKTIVAEKNARMESFKRCIRGPLFGFEMCIRGVITKPLCNHNKLMHYQAPWFGPNKIVLSMKSDGINSREVIIGANERRMSSGEGDEGANRQVSITMRSDSMQNKFEMEYETSARSIIPTKMNARWNWQMHNGQSQEMCINMDAQEQGDNQRSERTRRNRDIIINWGPRCSNENYVKAKIESVYNRKVYRDQQRWNNNNNNMDDEEGSQKQYGYGVSREETAGYMINIQHRNVAEWAVNRLRQFMDMVTSRNYWNSEVDYRKQGYYQNEDSRQRYDQIREGEIRVQAIMRNEERADVKIQTPKETIRLTNVYMPALLQRETYRRSNLMRFMNLYMGSRHAKGTCQIRQNSIRTFDGAVYRVPFSDCYTILAKDSEEDPNFAIMARRLREQPDKKNVKIMTSDHEIELTPERQGIEVKVDGQRLDDQQVNQHRYMHIRRQGNDATVDLKRPNVEVNFDGNEINIRVSDKYHGRQMGMCGNLNGDSSDDFETSSEKSGDEIWDTFNRMTMTSESCQRPQRWNPDDNEQFDSQDTDNDDNWGNSGMTSWHQRDEYDDDYDNERYDLFESNRDQRQRGDRRQNQNDRSLAIDDVLTETAPIRRNKVVENRGRKCISTRPIERCPEHSYAAQGEKEEKQVSYTCPKANDELKRKMGQLQRHGMSIDLSDREVSFTRKETVPRKCISIV
uniref:Vitellogenin domain-containing protein n=1 Tax=Trichuris muris TaxID=70415 RepID=A0A5S6QWJ9_TRIMR